MESKAAPTQSSFPSGTDRFFLRHTWHFVPGYSRESLRDNKSPDHNNYLSAYGLTPQAKNISRLGRLIPDSEVGDRARARARRPARAPLWGFCVETMPE
jgi:hypothetical protein